MFFLSYCSDEGLIFEGYGFQFHVQAESFATVLTKELYLLLITAQFGGFVRAFEGEGGC